MKVIKDRVVDIHISNATCGTTCAKAVIEVLASLQPADLDPEVITINKIAKMCLDHREVIQDSEVQKLHEEGYQVVFCNKVGVPLSGLQISTRRQNG